MLGFDRVSHHQPRLPRVFYAQNCTPMSWRRTLRLVVPSLLATSGTTPAVLCSLTAEILERVMAIPHCPRYSHGIHLHIDRLSTSSHPHSTLSTVFHGVQTVYTVQGIPRYSISALLPSLRCNLLAPMKFRPAPVLLLPCSEGVKLLSAMESHFGFPHPARGSSGTTPPMSENRV